MDARFGAESILQLCLLRLPIDVQSIAFIYSFTAKEINEEYSGIKQLYQKDLNAYWIVYNEINAESNLSGV